MHMQFDFSPLRGMLTEAAQTRTIFIGVTILFAGIALSIPDGTTVQLAIILVLMGLALIARQHIIMQRMRQQALQTFATQNNLQFSQEVPAKNEVGSLFSHGSSRNGSNGISGTFSNLSFQLFDYSYDTGSGKSRRTHKLTVLSFNLPRHLPHMVIDSLVEPGSNGSSALPIVFNRNQRIELEGNFNRYFDLYAPDTYGISALTIVAPDVMMTLMQHAALCDIEIIDNKLYFYWPIVADEADEFEKIFSTAKEVLEEVQTKLTRSNIYATETQAKIHSAENPQGGIHLQRPKNLPIFTGIAMIAIVATLLQWGPEYFSAIYTISIWAIIISLFIKGIWDANQRKRRLRELQERYTTHAPNHGSKPRL